MIAPKAPGALCAKCPAATGVFVPPEPSARSRLIVVGESPGKTELEQRRPFVGKSGRGLGSILRRAIGVERADVHWTNAVLCECPKEHLAAARKACLPRLDAELSGAPAGAPILALGVLGTQSALRLSRRPQILKWRGFVCKREDRYILPTVHPAFVMREPEWEWLLVEDCERLSRLNGWRPPEHASFRETRFVSASTERDRDHARAVLADLDHEISLDVETTGLSATECDLECVGMSDGRLTAVLRWPRAAEDRAAAARLISDVLRDRVAVTHNGPGFDHVVLASHGVTVGEWEDTILATHVARAHMPRGLDHVVSVYLDAPPWKAEHRGLVGDPEADVGDLMRYNAQDALYTELAWRGLRAEIEPELWSVYQQDKKVAALCGQMQRDGILFDVERGRELADRLRQREADLEARAAALLGREINLRSTRDLGSTMFGELRAPIYFRTDSGAPSLAAEALRAYAAHRSPAVRDLALIVLEYRSARLTRSLYIERAPVQSDGRIHPSWLNYGTDNSRWSCQRPNLQNLPKPQKDPVRAQGGVRSLFIAPPGHVIVAFDAKQLEMRVAAYWSGDAKMIAACESTDMHSANAAIIFAGQWEAAPADLRRELRDLAKTSGFAVVYGAEAPTVHGKLAAEGKPIPLKNVKAMMAALKSGFVGFYAAQREHLGLVMRRGWAESPISGRRLWMGHAPRPTKAGNFPIQSGAGDILNLRLPEIADRLPLDARVVAAVHDAAYIEAREQDADRVAGLCREIFEAPIEIKGIDDWRVAQFPIDIHIGRSMAG